MFSSGINNMRKEGSNVGRLQRFLTQTMKGFPKQAVKQRNF